MDNVQQRNAAKQFVLDWTSRGDEKQDAQNFWRQLLQKVFGVEDPEKAISFEYKVKNDQTNTTIFIDGYIHSTSVLIEQKSFDVDLSKGYRQSDGSMLTPFQQARRYAGLLPHNMNPRWIVVSNFQEFRIHNMNQPNSEPEIVKLSDFEKEYHRLAFLVDTGNENIRREMEISEKAGRLVGKLRDALEKQYVNPESERAQKSLNALCVRLVFCLYAEDADVFGRRLMFHDYMLHRGVGAARQALIDLFRVLDQDQDDRDPYLDDDLKAFPYVNGGLFSDENIEIPRITEEIFHLLLSDASEDFDWSEISPTIFGAAFESTLNPETRRKGGMHYTAIENIHKVIDPLFLDPLKEEFSTIKANPIAKTQKQQLAAFHNKLASLKFLDPAAGSGNFLTESYLSLRRLENEVIALEQGDQVMMGLAINPIKVSISQFYGIEINDFAVTVARTALWIAESQMMKETENIVHMPLEFLPLKTNATIIEGNALRLDWESIVPQSELSYIMGNPPFVGARWMSKAQKADVADTFGNNWKNTGDLDYVCCWYKKATDYIQGTRICCALVSTNSITQGGAVSILWKPLFAEGIHIDFAHRTFQWDSEAAIMAHVHCGILELTTFSSGLFKGNNTSLIFPLFVQKGYDFFIIGMMNQVGLCPDYSEDFKTAIYSPRLKEYINTFDERAGATLMRAWYGIQVALLHPVVKDIFSSPVTSYKHNDVEAKMYHHKARYIRKHIINSEDIEEALKIGEQKQQTRHTLIWYVIGHWRHYKDGRALFVKPYWKGPLRKTKTATTTRDREIVFQAMQKEKVDE